MKTLWFLGSVLLLALPVVIASACSPQPTPTPTPSPTPEAVRPKPGLWTGGAPFYDGRTDTDRQLVIIFVVADDSSSISHLTVDIEPGTSYIGEFPFLAIRNNIFSFETRYSFSHTGTLTIEGTFVSPTLVRGTIWAPGGKANWEAMHKD